MRGIRCRLHPVTVGAKTGRAFRARGAGAEYGMQRCLVACCRLCRFPVMGRVLRSSQEIKWALLINRRCSLDGALLPDVVSTYGR